MDRDSELESRFARGELFLTEAAVVERMRREFLIPADDHVEYGGAIYDEQGRAALREIYGGYLDVARRHGMPLLLTSSTRRCNPERVAASRFAERNVMQDWMTFLRELRDERGDELFVGGLLGACGDAYRPQGSLSHPDARAFHRAQCAAFAEAGADFLLAATLPALSEARGLAEAMNETGLPFIVSFVVERTGLLLDGTPLCAAVTAIDDVSPPLCYMVNCVHPSNVLAALASDVNRDQPSLSRVKGIQGNTSTLSPGELDDSAELQCDGADSLAKARSRSGASVPSRSSAAAAEVTRRIWRRSQPASRPRVAGRAEGLDRQPMIKSPDRAFEHDSARLTSNISGRTLFRTYQEVSDDDHERHRSA